MSNREEAPVQFVIAGAQKAASSFLHHQLDHHPDIHCPWREIAALDDAVYSPETEKSFMQQFVKEGEGKTRGFKRPDLLGMLYAPKRLANLNPDLKIILVLRNPSKRAISAYFHTLINPDFPFVDINQGFDRIFHEKSEDILDEMLRRNGMYYECIKYWLSIFPRQQFLILKQEEMLADKQRHLDMVTEFLGVEQMQVLGGSRAINKEGAYSYQRIRVRRLLIQIIKPFLNIGRNPFYSGGNWIYRVGYRVILELDYRVLVFIFSKSPEIDERTLRLVAEFYRDDVLDLSRLLEEDFAEWMA